MRTERGIAMRIVAVLAVVAAIGGRLPADPPASPQIDPVFGADKPSPAPADKQPVNVNKLFAGSNGSFGLGAAKVQLFGLEAQGYKIVYVFDRSASMGNGPGSPLELAKRELLASLKGLEEVHQFQIIFYNQRPTIFALAGQKAKPAYGTDENRSRAEKFVRGIVAEGSTEHEPALLAAYGLNPDAIFFLTDAGEPELSAAQLTKLTDRNRSSATINVVEFGGGPKKGGENFLGRLAKMNRGGYTYVDVTAQPAGKPAR